MKLKGETLIEVLIALSIAVVVITTITTLSISSLSNTQFVRDQNQAAKYAQEGLETMRSLRNSDYGDYATYGSATGLTYCLGENETTLDLSVTSCTIPNIVDKFIRSVTIELDGGCGTDLVYTVVNVSWTSGKCSGGSFCHMSTLSSCMSTEAPIANP